MAIRTINVEHNIKDENGNVVKVVQLEVSQAETIADAIKLCDGLDDATLNEDGSFFERKRGRLADGEVETPWSVTDYVNAAKRNQAKSKYTDPVETRMKIEAQMRALQSKLEKLSS